MGRAINNENDIQELKREVEQLKTAFSGLADTVDSLKNTATTNKHVDLHSDTRNVQVEGKPAKKNKKVKKKLVAEAEA